MSRRVISVILCRLVELPSELLRTRLHQSDVLSLHDAPLAIAQFDRTPVLADGDERRFDALHGLPIKTTNRLHPDDLWHWYHCKTDSRWIPRQRRVP